MLTCYIRHVYQTNGVELIGSTEYVLVTLIDSIGRLQQVNNFLTTLDLPSISQKSTGHVKACWVNN